MVKRQMDRKHSTVVVEKILTAHAPVKHLPTEELDAACRDFDLRQQALAAGPEHIKVIRRLGVVDAVRGYTDEDIALYVEAKDLAKREIESPSDFVSKGTNTVGQSVRAKSKRNRENLDYVDIWGYVVPKLRRNEMMKSIVQDAVTYFERRQFSERKITRAMEWARKNPDKVSDDR